jgi:hypothetical protein
MDAIGCDDWLEIGLYPDPFEACFAEATEACAIAGTYNPAEVAAYMLAECNRYAAACAADV